jgi:nickel transport protein
MFGRSTPLSPPALLGGLLVLLAAAGTAQAHRLNAQFFVLPEHKVQIESWFENGDSPRSARVQVFRADGRLLTEGRLNEKGLFVFSFPDAEPLKVVVNAGAGHRKELQIAAEELVHSSPSETKAGSTPSGTSEDVPGPVARGDRSSQVPIKDVLVGVGFLLAVAAFVLSLRNARQLRAMSREKDGPQDEARRE